MYLVVYHTKYGYTAITQNSTLYNVLDLGNMATSIFFVLSGFLLTHVYVAPIKTQPVSINKRAFWVARFANLYPLHIFGLVLTLPWTFLAILTKGGINVPLQLGSEVGRILPPKEIFVAFISHVTLTHAWNPLYQIFNIPSWSLSALLFFYLLFPYLAPLLAKIRSPLAWLLWMGILFAMPGAIAQFFGFSDLITDGVLHRNPLVRLPLFLSGIILYLAYQQRFGTSGTVMDTSSRLPLIGVIAITIFMAVYLHPGKNANFPPLIRNGLYYPAALAMIWLGGIASDKVAAGNRKWSARLGKASLSIFILHLPLYAIFVRLEKFVFVSLNDIHAFTDLHTLVAAVRLAPPQIGLYAVHLLLIVWISVFFQERIATPLHQLLRKKLAKPSMVSSSTTVIEEMKGENLTSAVPK